MPGEKKKKGPEQPVDWVLTKKGRRLMREEHYLSRLTPQERKTYEECLALLQGLSEDDALEEACEILEKYVSRRSDKDDADTSTS